MKGTRDAFDSVWVPYLLIAGTVAVLVIGSIAYAVLRYRVRGDKASREELPERTGRLVRLQIAYALAVAVAAGVALSFTFHALTKISTLTDEAPVATIDVTAFRWGWRFDYGEGSSSRATPSACRRSSSRAASSSASS